jgi:hypothetical protein
MCKGSAITRRRSMVKLSEKFSKGKTAFNMHD